jgi:hypothetical protein
VLANNGFDADKATKNVKGTISRSLCAREAILNKAFLNYCLTDLKFLSHCATKSSWDGRLACSLNLPRRLSMSRGEYNSRDCTIPHSVLTLTRTNVIFEERLTVSSS